MLKGSFILAGKTVNTASNLVESLKSGALEAGEMYSYGRDSTTIALAKVEGNIPLHPQGWSPKNLVHSVTSSITGLLTVQDVRDGKYISAGGVVKQSIIGEGEDVQFNLLSSLKDDRNIIMKSMLELELEGKLKSEDSGDYIKTSYGSVFINQNLKERMIEEGIFTREKYDASLQILIKFQQFQQLPGFIADTVVVGTKITVSLLIDILLLKFLFSVL